MGGVPTQKYESAVADLDKSIEINANNFLAWANRGELYMEWGNYLLNVRKDPTEKLERAALDIDRSIALNSNHYQSWLNRGIIRICGMLAIRNGMCKGDLKELYSRSLDDLSTAMRVNPGYGETYMRRGFARWLMKDYENAVSDFKRGANIDPGLAQHYKVYWDDAVQKSQEHDY